jgi:hypothetical protein
VTNFLKTPPEDKVFGCAAGRDRLALSPDGRLWGCYFFYDYARKMGAAMDRRYCFGTPASLFRSFERTYPRVLRSYANLNMGTFWTDRRRCGACPEVQDCVVCPVDAAFASGLVGRITAHDCRVRGILRKERARLWEGLEPLPSPVPALGRQANA